MLRTTVTALALALAASTALPAHATDAGGVGVGSCTATYVANGTGTHAFCYFVAQPGNYTLGIVSTATYAWSRVTCTPNGGGGEAAISGSGSASKPVALFGYLCTLEVAATGGNATGWVN